MDQPEVHAPDLLTLGEKNMSKAQAVAKVEPQGQTIAITPMQMLQIAVERGADLDKLQQLMDLNDRWEANEAKKAFVVALNDFKTNPPAIIKNKHVSFAGRGGGAEYDHATLDHVSGEIGKALSEHGLTHRWEINQGADASDVRITVTCVLTHEKGHSERVSMWALPDDSGAKNKIQAIGSTVTYLQRYTLLAATGLAAGPDDDGKMAGSDPITAEQKDELIALIKETDADTAKFMAYFGVGAVDELQTKDFDAAKAALEKKRGKK